MAANPLLALPDPLYYARYATTHLKGAECIEELHGLLWLEYEEEEQVRERKQYNFLDRFFQRQPTYSISHSLRRYRPAWYALKAENYADLPGFLADVAHASSLASSADLVAWERDKWGEALGYLGRYLLMQGSINSMAAGAPLELVSLLVEKGIWNAGQALAYIQQVPDEKQRTQALVELSPHFSATVYLSAPPDEKDPPSLFKYALEHVEKMRSPQQQADALIGLVRSVSPIPEELMARALELALHMEYEGILGDSQVRALAGLVPYLPESLLGKWLNALSAEWSGADLEEVLKAAAPYLSPESLRELLERLEESEFYRLQDASEIEAAFILELAKRDDSQEAWLRSEKIFDDDWRIATWARIIPYLPETWEPWARERLLAEILWQGWVDFTVESPSGRYPILREPKEGAVPMTFIGTYKPEVLAELLPYVPDEVFTRGLGELISRWDAHHEGAWVFPKLLESLPTPRREEVLQQALERMQDISSNDHRFKNQRRRARAFTALIPFLTPALHEAALQVVAEFEDPLVKTQALRDLIPVLLPASIGQAIGIVKTLEPYLEARLDTLADLAPYLDQASLGQVTTEAMKVSESPRRAILLSKVLPALPANDQHKVRQQLQEAIEETGHRSARRLVELAAHLPDEFQTDVVIRALRSVAIEDEREGAVARARLIQYLPDDQITSFLDGVRAAVEKVFPQAERRSLASAALQDEREGVVALLLPLVARYGNPKIALEWVAEQKAEKQMTTLAGLAAYLPEKPRAQVFWRSFAMAEATDQLTRWAEEIGKEAIHLPDTMLHQIEQAIRGVPRESERASVLAALIRSLPVPFVVRSVELLSEMVTDERLWASTLVACLPHLPAPIQEQRVKQLRQHAWAEWPTPLLLHMLRWLPEACTEDRLRQIMAGLSSPQEGETFMDHWSLLIPLLSGDLLQEAHTLALSIQDRYIRIWALARLARVLPEGQGGQLAVTIIEEMPQASLNELGTIRLLAELLPSIPESHQLAVTAEAFDQLLLVRQKIPNIPLRSDAIQHLAVSLAAYPLSTLDAVWRKMHPRLVNRQRKEMLAYLGDVAPVLAALGGARLIGELLQAIPRVERWWP